MSRTDEPREGRRTGESDKFQRAGEVHKIVIEALRRQTERQQKTQQQKPLPEKKQKSA